MKNLLADIGRGCIGAVSGLGRVTDFAGRILYWSFTSLPQRRILMPLMHEVGVRSVPVVLATGTFMGMVLAVQMYSQLHRLGAENAAGMIINISMVKELGPVLAAVILAGRVGGAMAAELGTMRVTEQVDALTAMGANPVRYLVVPRFLATLLLTPILTIFSDAIGVVGGWVVSTQALRIDSFFYWQNTREILERWDIWVGIFKSFFFGGLIGIIACYKGFTCGRGAEGVGRATTMAFVATFISILVSNFFLAVLFRHIYNHFIGVTAVR
ncbi:MAG TPA: ABC transporter permease [Planctomycetota bacterium]|nr:ABC transporter permease [Planctomycetota bacterium]